MSQSSPPFTVRAMPIGVLKDCGVARTRNFSESISEAKCLTLVLPKLPVMPTLMQGLAASFFFARAMKRRL